MAKMCPICEKPSKVTFAPFCSRRCGMRDLARWIGGDEPYVIAGEPGVPDPTDAEDQERSNMMDNVHRIA